MSEEEFEPLMDVGGDPDVATLTVEPETHGWSVEALIENSREYLPDGVESATATVRCFVSEPDDLRALAARLEAKAEVLEEDDGA